MPVGGGAPDPDAGPDLPEGVLAPPLSSPASRLVAAVADDDGGVDDATAAPPAVGRAQEYRMSVTTHRRTADHRPRSAHRNAQPAAVRTADLARRTARGDNAVHALDGVDVDFAAGQFTAVMGPSGSGKSTLMHVTAGLDTATSGTVWIGDTDLTTLKEKAADPAAPGPGRLRVPAVQPGADADRRREHRAADAPRRPPPDQAWLDRIIEVVGLRRPAPAPARASSPAGSSSGSPWPARWSRAPRWSSRTSRPATSTRAPALEVLSFLRRSVDENAQTIVMVTHDPVAASHADRVVFLADGRVVDDMTAPTAERVLDRMKNLEG